MKRSILSAAILVCALTGLLLAARGSTLCSWDLRNNLWGPVHMLVRGQSPYSFETPYGPYAGVWMPVLPGALFFLGFLSCDVVSKVWLAAGMGGFVWVIWWAAGGKKPAHWAFAVCLFALLLFPPLWVHLQLGQFALLFAVLMAALASRFPVGRAAPFLLALGLAKPQLAMLVYPGLLLRAWREEGLWGALRLALATAGCAALFTIPLFLFYPGWTGNFMAITFMNIDNTWGQPTLFFWLPQTLGAAGVGIWALVALAGLGASLWFWARKDPRSAMAGSLAITPLVAPYAFSWDFVLLLPAFFLIFQRLGATAARLALALGVLAIDAALVASRWQRDISDGDQWWVPTAVLLVYLIALAVERVRRHGAEESHIKTVG
jgi:hypothetical protein